MPNDIWQGAEACAKGAMKAGLSFFAGYPITPSTEIAEMLSILLTEKGKVFMQMEDEIASIVSVVGASMAGAKAMTATSGPGFSLMQEGIGYACMVEAPIVICNVMRGGPSTGDPTKVSQGDVMQAKWGTHGDHGMIVICPDSATEMYYMTIKAFNLAEKYRNPVILLTDETITHMREKVEIDIEAPVEIVNRLKPVITPDKPYLPYGNLVDDVAVIGNLGDGLGTSITGMVHREDGFQSPNFAIANPLIQRLVAKIDKHASELFEVEVINGDAENLIITYGITSRTVKSLIFTGHKNIGLIRLKTLFPFHDETIQKLTQNAKHVFVAELNLGQIFLEAKRAIGHDKPVSLISKVGGHLITPEEMINFIEGSIS
jgi:2-oxoglutarate ferredoxin oxidoreductase subunit alpha